MPIALALPYPVLPGAQRQPLHGVAASRAIEAQALADEPPFALMQRAGAAVASLAAALAPHAESIWIAAGPGNNGGDGLEAAAQLAARGKQVQVWLSGDDVHLPADAQRALRHAREAGVLLSTALPGRAEADLLIDALLGLGGNRPPTGAIAAAINLLNSTHGRPVLAVDLPSGLNADTGQVHGDGAVRATHTLSLLTLKPGLFTASGRDHAGAVWMANLGCCAARPPDAWLSGSHDWLCSHPRRAHGQHKGSFGDVLVVGGAAGMNGAALLAAGAALQAGAGRVYLDLLDGKAGIAGDPALMLRPGRVQEDPSAWAAATVVCGCGGGTSVETALPAVLAHSSRLVLDADALNAVARSPALQAALFARAQRQQITILTPHPLEAARLLGTDVKAVQSDRLRAAQALSERWQCVALLKGSGSLCAAPGRTPTVNSSGNALLASAGTGDVLAGWIGGTLSQGAPLASPLDAALGAAVASAWLHGRAADDAEAHRMATPLQAGRLAQAMAASAAALQR
jgi:hydroxyethylthiazole kinase-like uncharacterized protein yjeF